MYTEQERKVAGKIVENKEMMELLKKVFTPDRSAVRNELEKNIASLDDAEYGQLMKALVLAEASAETSLNNLKNIAYKEVTKKSPIAPK